VFFTASEEIQNASLVCISPHDLIREASARISVAAAPGVGSADDLAYNSPVAFGGEFDAKTHVFSAKIADLTKTASPQTVMLIDEVVTPEIFIPAPLRSDVAHAVMGETGTIFELRLRPLDKERMYALRLILEPQRLLGVSQQRPIESRLLTPPGVWSVDLHMICPRTCFFDAVQLLQTTRRLREFAETAAAAENIICDPELRVLGSDYVRIVLVLPPRADLRREHSIGCIVPLGPTALPSGQLVHQWVGGTKRFWVDDVESVARAVWNYLSTWARAEPKSKEAISTALGASHQNCSIVVDSLAEHGAIELADTDRRLYTAKQLSDRTLASITESISRDNKVKNRFEWTGYRVQYQVSYGFLRPRDKARMIWSKLVPYIALFLAILGLILSLIAFLGR